MRVLSALVLLLMARVLDFTMEVSTVIICFKNPGALFFIFAAFMFLYFEHQVFDEESDQKSKFLKQDNCNSRSRNSVIYAASTQLGISGIVVEREIERKRVLVNYCTLACTTLKIKGNVLASNNAKGRGKLGLYRQSPNCWGELNLNFVSLCEGRKIGG